MTMSQPASDVETNLHPFMLARLHVELESALRSHEDRLMQTPGPDDEVAIAARLRSEYARVEILDALERFTAGTYGVCETCQRPISGARLEAMPHARLCAACAHRGR